MHVSKYTKEYTVKSYEVDCHGFLRILSLMNMLQDVAVEHAESFGLGLENCLQQNLAWVGSNYLVQIKRLPKQHETFNIETWPAEAKLWGAIRDFTIKDKSGIEIVKASSQWVLIDVEKRRPVMLKKYFPNYETVHERVIETDFPKMASLISPEYKTEFTVRFDDIDVNQHVNNAVYPLWASESVENSFRLQHSPTEIEICYKKEALYGEIVSIHTSIFNNESFHTIYDQKSGDELALCRIKWQKI